MRGGVRGGALRDVDQKDDGLSGKKDFVGDYRAEGRDSGSDCTGMVSRTLKNTDPASNSKKRKLRGTVQICCYTNSMGKDITLF